MTLDAIEDQLIERARRVVDDPAAPFRVEKLQGDASSRVYYRLKRGGRTSLVAMVLPRSGSQSEEVTEGAPSAELPFINIQRYLKEIDIPVPEILLSDLEAGILLLEDLGETTFWAAQDRDGEAHRERLYEQAIDLLVALRSRADAHPDPSCLAFGRAFDFKLLRWEFDHYLEYGLNSDGRLHHSPSPSEQAVLDRHGDLICQALAACKAGFTHRDYQSRNLMVADTGLVIIDFQDALLGPREYDLVALLRDSYVELPEPFVDRMLERYRVKVWSTTGEDLDAAQLRHTFDLQTVQRKLKDSGRFIFIARHKDNSSFLPYIPPSLRYVARALERLPEHAELREVLRAFHHEMEPR